MIIGGFFAWVILIGSVRIRYQQGIVVLGVCNWGNAKGVIQIGLVYMGKLKKFMLNGYARIGI